MRGLQQLRLKRASLKMLLTPGKGLRKCSAFPPHLPGSPLADKHSSASSRLLASASPAAGPCHWAVQHRPARPPGHPPHLHTRLQFALQHFVLSSKAEAEELGKRELSRAGLKLKALSRALSH